MAYPSPLKTETVVSGSNWAVSNAGDNDGGISDCSIRVYQSSATALFLICNHFI